MELTPVEQNTGQRRPMPKNFAQFKHYHLGETMIVCGCGNSLREFTRPDSVITIGVNDVGRQFTPDYLVVLNPRNQFSGDRFQYVQNSGAKAVFTQLNLGITHQNLIRFGLAKRGGTDFSGAQGLPFTRNSPYVALCLALYMGATRIGLIGVDFTEHHFFAHSGRHPLTRNLASIDQEYKNLYQVAHEQGVEIVNLSAQSRLDALPKMSVDTFISHRGGGATTSIAGGEKEISPSPLTPLNIVSYSVSPVAGVPQILAQCINTYTPHSCRCVWANNRYGNGVEFDADIEWSKNPGRALSAIQKADLLIVHNGKIAAQHQTIVAQKAVITMAHNYGWNVEDEFVRRGFPGVVVAQYQATLAEFKHWLPVPNPIDADLYADTAGAKNPVITICYTPSGKHDVYPKNHRLYWHSKGYASTCRILQKLLARYPIKLEIIGDKQLSHRQVMAMKMRSHIVIDECVTGSYHRNSLEGLACGCVVINGLGLLDGVDAVFKQCFNQQTESPFIGCGIDQLEAVLVELIERGRDYLLAQGQQNRRWLGEHWNFAGQWRKFWQPLVAEALTVNRSQVSGGTVATAVVAQAPEKTTTNRLSMAVQRQTRLQQKIKMTTAHKNFAKDLAVYWTCRHGSRGNFGDMLSPIIIQALCGRKAVFRTQGPRLFAVGSLIKFARAGDTIWGTGFISASDRCVNGVKVAAVRGPLTRAQLLAQGIDCPEIYGDPALLLPRIFPPLVADGKKFAVGVVPHYVDYAAARRALAGDDIAVIDIRAGIEQTIHKIQQCEIILSSSLHGCIAAEAYGIPTCWVELSDKVVGGGFKFRDYYASTGRDPVYVDWRKKICLDKAVNLAGAAPSMQFDSTALIDAFPFASAIPVSTGAHVPSVNGKSQSGREPKNHHAIGVKADQAVNQNAGKIAIFSAATENYVEYIIASMRSFMHHNDSNKFDYFIFGNRFSSRTKRLINRYGIRYHNLNLKQDFNRTVQHRYPSECFWIFKGPEIFAEMGYRYSLSIDGDVLCQQPLVLDWLEKLQHLAGIDRGCSAGEFLTNLKQLERLQRGFSFSANGAGRRATNTGIVFYHNQALVELNFYQKMVEIYKTSERIGVVRGGDDSTLALFLSQYPEIDLHILPEHWNQYKSLFAAGGAGDQVVAKAYIIHFTQLKPWRHQPVYDSDVVARLTMAWRAFWPESKSRRRLVCLEQARVRRQPRQEKPVEKKIKAATSLPFSLYWYRGRELNMGDEICPYLINKITGQSVIEKPIKDPASHAGPVLLSVGSILRLSGGNTIIWGSGIRNVDQAVKPPLTVCAVRGPLTRRRLLQLHIDCPAIYGDPALLLPRFYQPSVNKQYKLGIIPHWLDQKEFKQHYAGCPQVLIIDVRTSDIEFIVRQILSCECTVSSSLHGLILSVAYGIPTKWVKCSDKIMGDDVKFYDFFASLEPTIANAIKNDSVTAIKQQQTFRQFHPLDLRHQAFSVDQLCAAASMIENTVAGDTLLSAFPMATMLSTRAKRFG